MAQYANFTNDRSQQEIEKRFNEADDERKLFVGGLSWNTTDEDLLRYFARFGAVEEAAMKRDRNGVPRGFAFIIYMETASVEKVMQSGSHVLNNRKIDPKRARSENTNGKARPRKIFVKNSKACSEEELREYFGHFGEITNIDLPVYTNDDNTFSRREYCFIEFDSEQAAIDASADSSHTIGTTTVEAKKFDVKHSGAAVSKGGPPDLVRKHKQRFAPYGMGGSQNMGYGNPGFMNQFDGSSMGSMMGYQQSPNMHTMRGPQNMGAPPQWGADPMNMGFGGGPRFNNQMDQFGGFNGYSGMSNQSFGARDMNMGGGGMRNMGGNNFMDMNNLHGGMPVQNPGGFYNSTPHHNYMGNNMTSPNNRRNNMGGGFYGGSGHRQERSYGRGGGRGGGNFNQNSNMGGRGGLNGQQAMIKKEF